MKVRKVLSIYGKYTVGIRLYGGSAVALYILAIICRDILRPIALRNIIDVVSQHSGSKVLLLVLVFFGVHTLAQIFFRAGEFLSSTFKARHMRALRNAAFKETIKHSIDFFTDNSTGSLVTKQNRFVLGAETLFEETMNQYAGVFVQVMGTIIVLSMISIPITACVVAWILLYGIVIKVSLKKRIAYDGEEARHNSKVMDAFTDVINNIRIVKNFGTAAYEQKRFENATQKHYQAFIDGWTFANQQSAIQAIFSIVVYTGGVIAGAILSFYYHVSVGNFVLITAYTGQLSGCLWDVGRSIKRSSKAIADAQEMIEIMETAPSIKDWPDALDEVAVKEGLSIRFEDVYFAYGETAILKNFNLAIPSQQKIAIVGATGAGKSTIVALLSRFADVQHGSVTIGPYNIKTDITQRALKTLISCVSQDVELFNRSLGENICYGKLDAAHDVMVDIATKAQIHNFIADQSTGYDTTVGEKNLRLSGGQSQRIAIARALLHDAPILVLDEATAALDNLTEKEIQNMFVTTLCNKTVVVIAHRLSTVSNCDRIIVLDSGTIVQDGTHDELINDKEGKYYHLVHSHDVVVHEDAHTADL